MHLPHVQTNWPVVTQLVGGSIFGGPSKEKNVYNVFAKQYFSSP